MKTITVIIREENRNIFEAIENGTKTVETRAGTVKYRQVEEGDVLVFICGTDKLEKTVTKVSHFSTAEDLMQNIPLNKIMPGVKNLKEAERIWFSFPGYEEKIKQFGLVAWEI